MIYCLLPEAEFDCSKLEAKEFLATHLHQTVAQKDSTTLVEKLARRVSSSQGRIRQLMEAPEMSDPNVASRVSVAMSATQPLLPTTLGSSFEGLMGQLGLNLTDTSEPPLTQREGYIERFAEAISGLFRDKGVDFEPNWIEQVVRHWDHKDEFEKRLAQPASVRLGGPLLPEFLPFLKHLHRQEMEDLEGDLDLGALEGVEVWESFKEEEVPHPQNLLNQMWRLVQKTVDNHPPEEEGEDPGFQGDPAPQREEPRDRDPPDRPGMPSTPATPQAFEQETFEGVDDQQLLGDKEEDQEVEVEQQPLVTSQQLPAVPAGILKPSSNPYVSLPQMHRPGSRLPPPGGPRVQL